MTAIDTKVALLQALLQGESYGLELIERVKKATGGRTTLMQGRVYPVLRQLESEGLLQSYNGEPLAERGGRPRRYYRLTAEGRRVARDDAKALAGLLKPALGAA
jgi:PadR family transcriptional regulator, regulatory protein PadR